MMKNAPDFDEIGLTLESDYRSICLRALKMIKLERNQRFKSKIKKLAFFSKGLLGK